MFANLRVKSTSQKKIRIIKVATGARESHTPYDFNNSRQVLVATAYLSYALLSSAPTVSRRQVATAYLSYALLSSAPTCSTCPIAGDHVVL